MDITFRDHRPARAALLDLYGAVGWTVYTRDPAALEAAIAGATWVRVAERGTDLIGLIRVLSDDVTMAFIQDVLVHPEAQRHGVGRALMEAALARFDHCRQVALLTDDRPEQTAFYESLGLVRLDRAQQVRLHAFARMPGLA
jgi:GNAT superfamily N-acetyltransferase